MLKNIVGYFLLSLALSSHIATAQSATLNVEQGGFSPTLRVLAELYEERKPQQCGLARLGGLQSSETGPGFIKA
jgi:hypothetical protein